MYVEKKNYASVPLPIPVVTFAIVILKLDGQLFVLKLVSQFITINDNSMRKRVHMLIIIFMLIIMNFKCFIRFLFELS